ncbi:hypothetical protein MKEN_01313800 [Mycena kentingensis (nom. inval.)]|nr:hypothetical protein MKEN_01313800 [Mycena kentingensis (nom. inval.)]
MADVAPAATVEINDGVFCTHFKEVVRTAPSSLSVVPSPHPLSPQRYDPPEYAALSFPRPSIPIPPCQDCSFDGREENDAFYGFDPIDREGIEAPAATLTKDGVYQCKKHASTSCSQCYGWKKQITRLRAAAKKAGKK